MTEINDTQRTFVRRSVWHIVDGDQRTGATVGAFYLFRCFRWARVAQIRDTVTAERLTADKELCVRCDLSVRLEADNASRGSVTA